MNLLNFKDEKLNVDWVSLNLKDLTDPISIKDMAVYLSKFGFNSRKFYGDKDFCEKLIFLSTNNFNVDFRVYSSDKKLKNYWCGTIIIFSGFNAKHFYDVIKNKDFNWGLLDYNCLSLGRFDLNYFRPNKRDYDQTDPLTLNFFMEQSYQNCKKNLNLNTDWVGISGSRILRVGQRGSSNYYRIYETFDGLKFELELKRRITKSIQESLFLKNFTEFEDKVSRHFYKISSTYFFLDTEYTDWLTNRVRELLVIKKPAALTYFVSHYLIDSDYKIKKMEEFMTFLQFLSFVRTIDISRDSLFNFGYCNAKFLVKDFLAFKGIKSPSNYEIKKTVKFFGSLQDLKPYQYFSKNSFRSLVVFPQLEVTRDAGKPYMVSFTILEDLYLKDYPFAFPSRFFSYKNKYELCLKFEFIKSFCNLKVKKRFDIETFLAQFAVPNQERTKIKRLVCCLFEDLVGANLIEKDLELIHKDGSVKNISKLTTLNINQSIFIYFYEVLN